MMSSLVTKNRPLSHLTRDMILFQYMDVMEYFDIVDENGVPTGETVGRTEAHDKGIRHRTAHVWVVRMHGGKPQVLLQKRTADKESFPGCYDTSSAGHIVAGDEPLPSAIRELGEELGIEASGEELEYAGTFETGYEKIFHGKPFRDNEITFVYIYSKPVITEALRLQKEEVESVKWFDADYVREMIEPPRDERFCVPSGGFNIVMEWINRNWEPEAGDWDEDIHDPCLRFQK